ncbi:hypothetical protein CASFOL_026510 [Castilleja foliolosa]|uniref:KIB1-4 beta-propeller domain-containing protein n=1 Tax=Castilleja foliolosa TaxID=1961234 RepID=A0ABD3CH98_9LAMI
MAQSARSCASSFNRRALRTASAIAMTAIEAVPKQESSPWLMLPPEIESKPARRVISSIALQITKSKPSVRMMKQATFGLRLTCRGSSHGWLALLSQHDDGFFLYNPISRRHMKLPSILNLPTSPYNDILTSARYVDKVILSCSPDEDEDNCRVLLLRDCGNVLAFCCPGRSQEWTLMLDEQRGKRYINCVYSTRLKLFFALTQSNRVETWNLEDLSSPKLIKMRIMFNVGPDGSYCDDSDNDSDEPRPDSRRYITIGFDIFKYDDSEKGKFKYLDRSSLGGLAIFVGEHNHAVAIQATQFPELKPNSIYFTDGGTITKTKLRHRAIIHVMFVASKKFCQHLSGFFQIDFMDFILVYLVNCQF